MPPTITDATVAILTTIEQFIWLKDITPKLDKFVVRSTGRIVIVSPVTRHKLIPEGSTAASMPPTVTSVIMPILTNPLAARSAKRLLPQSVFRSLNALIKIKVVGLHPTPDQGGLLVLSSLDAPRRPQRS